MRIHPTLEYQTSDAKAKAAKAVEEASEQAPDNLIRAFQFRDIRPKGASETDLAHFSKLQGQTDKQTTRMVSAGRGKSDTNKMTRCK